MALRWSCLYSLSHQVSLCRSCTSACTLFSFASLMVSHSQSLRCEHRTRRANTKRMTSTVTLGTAKGMRRVTRGRGESYWQNYPGATPYVDHPMLNVGVGRLTGVLHGRDCVGFSTTSPLTNNPTRGTLSVRLKLWNANVDVAGRLAWQNARTLATKR